MPTHRTTGWACDCPSTTLSLSNEYHHKKESEKEGKNKEKEKEKRNLAHQIRGGGESLIVLLLVRLIISFPCIGHLFFFIWRFAWSGLLLVFFSVGTCAGVSIMGLLSGLRSPVPSGLGYSSCNRALALVPIPTFLPWRST